MPPGRDAKVFASQMMEPECIQTSIIATKDTLPSLVGYGPFFEHLPSPGNIVLVLALLTTELALPP
jgi:hypothetical protein